MQLPPACNSAASKIWVGLQQCSEANLCWAAVLRFRAVLRVLLHVQRRFAKCRSKFLKSKFVKSSLWYSSVRCCLAAIFEWLLCNWLAKVLSTVSQRAEAQPFIFCCNAIQSMHIQRIAVLTHFGAGAAGGRIKRERGFLDGQETSSRATHY